MPTLRKRQKSCKGILTLSSAKEKMGVLDALKLRGRMQFADGQLLDGLGKLYMRAVVMHAFPFRGDKLASTTRDALRRFALFLEHAVGP